MMLPEKKLRDRRVQRTQKLLREALFALIHEKNYDSIVVEDILKRADIGRSTFYMHFAGKDELLVSAMHTMLHSTQVTAPAVSVAPADQIISFSLPILEHVAHHLRAGQAKIGPRGRAVIHEHLQGMLTELIADRVRKVSQTRTGMAVHVPPDLCVAYVASTFILLLNWWLEAKRELLPGQVNELFRALVLPTLAGKVPAPSI
jgi:AcrR family transcriptional regulator